MPACADCAPGAMPTPVLRGRHVFALWHARGRWRACSPCTDKSIKRLPGTLPLLRRRLVFTQWHAGARRAPGAMPTPVLRGRHVFALWRASVGWHAFAVLRVSMLARGTPTPCNPTPTAVASQCSSTPRRVWHARADRAPGAMSTPVLRGRHVFALWHARGRWRACSPRTGKSIKRLPGTLPLLRRRLVFTQWHAGAHRAPGAMPTPVLRGRHVFALWRASVGWHAFAVLRVSMLARRMSRPCNPTPTALASQCSSTPRPRGTRAPTARLVPCRHRYSGVGMSSPGGMLAAVGEHVLPAPASRSNGCPVPCRYSGVGMSSPCGTRAAAARWYPADTVTPGSASLRPVAYVPASDTAPQSTPAGPAIP